MYRSLSDRGSLTEYVYVSHYDVPAADPRVILNLPNPSLLFFLLRSSDPPQFSSKAPNPTVQRRGTNIYGLMPLASARQSEGTQTTYGAPVFLPADQTHVEFVPGGSIPSQG